MCAGGIPVPNTTNPKDAVRAALALQAYMQEFVTNRKAERKPYWEVRIGLHTGPIISGVVGTQKFAYDIWGDTVNTASRMESNSEVGKINVSAQTYELIKDEFICTPRGYIEVKGKGKMQMYFVEKAID
jgi:class 3 adenylate cyclase